MKPSERPVVVTGASSGIGEMTARILAEQGHPVVLGARRLDRCKQIASDIIDAGGNAFAVPLDLAEQTSISAFVQQTEDLVGLVEVLVSNAGAMRPAKAMTAELAEFERHLQINVLGPHALVQAFGKTMMERHRGDLVFITSEMARAPRPGVAPYLTSKFAVEGLIAALQMELEGTGVRVSTIRPGQTLTEMGMDWDPSDTDELLTSWERWGLARHGNFIPATGIAAAVAAVVGAPPEVSFTVLEVEPIAPVTHVPPVTKPHEERT